MRITKLDVLIVLIIVVWLYFSFTGAKYFEVKGKDIFGGVVTYNTLSGRGYGVNADVIGITIGEQGLRTVSGVIIGATDIKLYLWDGSRVWVLYQKDRFLQIEERPLTPYIYPSSITMYPDESFRVVEGQCGGGAFRSETLYVELDKPADEVLCSYISGELWDRYSGEVECSHGGNHMALVLTLLKGFEPSMLESQLSAFGYKAEKILSSGTNCLVIEYD